ncbi:MAG: hypothetical protein K9M81_02765 [Chthoniobacterales bacterium]|nr:hypothetical protein [Chthoniobacterales bacterium]
MGHLNAQDAPKEPSPFTPGVYPRFTPSTTSNSPARKEGESYVINIYDKSTYNANGSLLNFSQVHLIKENDEYKYRVASILEYVLKQQDSTLLIEEPITLSLSKPTKCEIGVFSEEVEKDGRFYTLLKSFELPGVGDYESKEYATVNLVRSYNYDNNENYGGFPQTFVPEYFITPTSKGTTTLEFKKPVAFNTKDNTLYPGKVTKIVTVQIQVIVTD